jgi:hypothetical protein
LKNNLRKFEKKFRGPHFSYKGAETVDMTSHESDDRLELYALGRLPDSDLIGIEEHLIGCDSCRERLDETANVAFAMRDELLSNPLPFHAGRGAWFEWLKPSAWAKPQFAFAGALAMAILAIVFAWQGNSNLAPVASLQLTAMRGSDIQTVQAAREIDITLSDAAGAQSVEVVDGTGGRVWSGAPETVGGEVQARVVKALSPGQYFARVYDSPGHLMHEYMFRVKK